jgi:hypothetical protein
MDRLGFNGTEGARTASILNLIAGLWLIITPFRMGYYLLPAPLWNSLIVGAVVGVLALIRAFDPGRNVVLSWINLILGLWLIVSPFILHNAYHMRTLAINNDVIAGIVIAVLSVWSAAATPTYARTVR